MCYNTLCRCLSNDGVEKLEAAISHLSPLGIHQSCSSSATENYFGRTSGKFRIKYSEYIFLVLYCPILFL